MAGTDRFRDQNSPRIGEGGAIVNIKLISLVFMMNFYRNLSLLVCFPANFSGIAGGFVA